MPVPVQHIRAMLSYTVLVLFIYSPRFFFSISLLEIGHKSADLYAIYKSRHVLIFLAIDVIKRNTSLLTQRYHDSPFMLCPRKFIKMYKQAENRAAPRFSYFFVDPCQFLPLNIARSPRSRKELSRRPVAIAIAATAG